MVTNNIPRMTKARHATAQSPWPVLGSAAACVVAGLVCLVVLVAGVLMDAGAGLASDLGDGSGMGGGIFAGLDLIARLFFATGLCIPRGIATSGLTGTGLGLPRRRLGAYGFNYHMLSKDPTDVNHAGATKGPARRRHKQCRRKRAALAGNARAGAGRIHPMGIHDKPAIGGVHAKEAAVLARSAASSNNAHAAQPGPETPGSS